MAIQTIKLKYIAPDNFDNILRIYQKEYSMCTRYMFNRLKDTNGKISEIELRKLTKTLKYVDHLNSYFFQCSIKEAKEIYKSYTQKLSVTFKPNKRWSKEITEKKLQKFNIKKKNLNKIIFGKRVNFIKRIKGEISNKEWQEVRLMPLYSIGEGPQKGNRFFNIDKDLNIIFKPNKNEKYKLKLINLKNRKFLFENLYLKQLDKKTCIPVTYKINQNNIFISFNSAKLVTKEEKLNKSKIIKNRSFAIDLNPNYIGWSVVDWESSNTFNVVDNGIINIKFLNDKIDNLKLASDNPLKKHWVEKRKHEINEIAKQLIIYAKHYFVQTFNIEDLDINSQDFNKGKSYNKLINNSWIRNTLINNLNKRCDILDIKLQKVKPQYSSFVGNFLFRSLNLPDMVLSSIELGRRGYEFYNQYISKTKQPIKNIIQPQISDFTNFYFKSCEEFKIKSDFKNLIEVYNYFKKDPKQKYRLSLDQFPNLKFSRFFSKHSLLGFI